MEWDLKMPPWDLIELEQDAAQSVGQVVVVRPCGDGRMAPRANIVDCSVDLKLGGFGDIRPGKNSWTDNPLQTEQQQQQQQPPAASVMPSSTPPKRPRPLSTGPQIASCSVDGCEADLSKCREYHRRHKVCEVHSKTPVVTVRGREQRFCQQCSRFHLLTEFDDVKRSCRKRLDGHNKRRRKPQPNSLKTGNLYPGHQGSMFTMSPQLFPVSAPEQSWSGTVKSEDIIYRQCTSPQLMDRDFCFTNSYCYNKQGKQFPFLQKSDTILSSKNMLGTCQTPLTTISLSGSNGDGSSKMFSHVVTPVFRSDCALSLLSSPTQTSGINMIHMVPPTDRIPMGQPLISNSHCAAAANLSPSAASKSVSHTGFPCSVMEDGAIFVSDDNASNVRCQSIFNVGVEGSSDGTLQMLPFSWN